MFTADADRRDAPGLRGLVEPGSGNTELHGQVRRLQQGDIALWMVLVHVVIDPNGSRPATELGTPAPNPKGHAMPWRAREPHDTDYWL